MQPVHMRRATAMDELGQLGPVLETKLMALGLEVYGMRCFKAGGRQVLRVFVDRDGGVTIAECERASRELSVLLDVEGFASGRPYTLEVSSPGTDWPLLEERDYRRIAGHEVTLRLAEPLNGAATLRGRVTGCGDGQVRIEQDGKQIAVPLSAIAQGRVELSFK